MLGSPAEVADELQANRGGAKALLLTVLGEFVLPAGGEIWTSTLVAAADTLGIGEKNARQAIARITDQGLIEGARHGRAVRWSLTPTGRDLLESGARRIYGFAASTADWGGEWLVVHCPVPEQERGRRNQLRTQLAFLGFGELSASLLVSPHVDRQPEARDVLGDLGLLDDSTILRSTTGSHADDIELTARAWDLEALADSYTAFVHAFADRRPATADGAFAATVELVHDWRRFLFIDPELPTTLLPDQWVGATAGTTFHDRRAEWTTDAQRWFTDTESSARAAS